MHISSPGEVSPKDKVELTIVQFVYSLQKKLFQAS